MSFVIHWLPYMLVRYAQKCSVLLLLRLALVVSGKARLVNLLLRLYEPTSGQVS